MAHAADLRGALRHTLLDISTFTAAAKEAMEAMEVAVSSMETCCGADISPIHSEVAECAAEVAQTPVCSAAPRVTKPDAYGSEGLQKVLPSQPLTIVQLDMLLTARGPIQEQAGGVESLHLGLGHRAEDNIAMRRRVGHPGAPFGGMGFVDPQKEMDDPNRWSMDDPNLWQMGGFVPAHITKDFVRETKMQEFRLCSKGKPSIYYWALQPIVDQRNQVVAAEILVRAKNGTDCAPFEDVIAMMDPQAPEEVQQLYAAWKAEEAVNWPLRAMKRHPILKQLRYISTNLRPMDLMPTSPVYREITRQLDELTDADKELLKRKLVIEVTEDQDPPVVNLDAALESWRHGLGFRLSYDDTVGDKACLALGKMGSNFHTLQDLRPVLKHFDWLKVDIEWAGICIFLCHPSYAKDAKLSAEVLENATLHDQVWMRAGRGLRNTGAKHSALLQEFADWSLEMIDKGRNICIELSVTGEDENAAYALAKLQELGLDILGEHRSSFHFQGGATGAKAFEPSFFASALQLSAPR